MGGDIIGGMAPLPGKTRAICGWQSADTEIITTADGLLTCGDNNRVAVVDDHRIACNIGIANRSIIVRGIWHGSPIHKHIPVLQTSGRIQISRSRRGNEPTRPVARRRWQDGVATIAPFPT